MTDPPEWQIENFDPTLWITVDTAITYVASMRDKANDPVIKSNADRTLATLKHLL